MSAQADQTEVPRIELRLPPTAKIPRELLVTLNRDWVQVSVYPDLKQPNGRPSVAFTSASMYRCHLTQNGSSYFLFVGTTSFELTQDEMKQVREKFNFRVKS